MLGKLSEKQALHLEVIMKNACGEDGCNIPQRKRIVKSFLSNNGLILKNSDSELVSIAHEQNNGIVSERFTDVEAPTEERNIQSGVSTSSGLFGGKGIESFENFESSNKSIKDKANTSDVPATSVASLDRKLEKVSINKILEDIMSQANLKKRAEERRKIAYMQGGDSVDDKNYREPSGYKSDKMSETVRNTQDRHLLQDGDMNKLTREDLALKEKLSRAALAEARLRRIAYMQGGDSVDDKNYREPSGYKSDKMSETVRNTQDRHLLQDGDMNKLTREDMALKEKLKRASDSSKSIVKKAYAGPALTTRFTVKRDANGSVNKKASVFEVFSGDKRVIAATAGTIFGNSLPENWDWIKSAEYGKEVCKEIRASGVDYVGSLLKSAQAAPAEMPPMGPDAGAAAPMDAGMAAPEAAAPMPEMPMEGSDEQDEASEDESEDPSKEIDEELTAIEQSVSTVRDLVGELEGSAGKDVDVNVFTGKEGEEGSEKLALSRALVQNLKKAYRQLDSSADELAMVAETYENINKLSASQRREFKKLAAAARRDSAKIHGETMALVRIASSLKKPALRKRAQEVEDFEMDMSMDDMGMDMSMDDMDMDMSMDMAMDDMADNADDSADLVSEAMSMRKARRESILKKAESSLLASRASARNALLKRAEEAEMEDDAKDKHHKKDEKDEDKKEEKGDDKKNPFAKKEDKKSDKSDDLNDMSASLESSGFTEGMRSQDHMPSGMKEHMQSTDTAKVPAGLDTGLAVASLSQRAMQKKAQEERDAYRVKLRRAYDVGMEMQKKGLLPLTKSALDKQVDDIMEFDDNAFEAFKRSVANAKAVRTMKVASDLGGVNVGVESDTSAQPTKLTADKLMNLWG